MSPRRNTRPNLPTSSPDGPHATRDTTQEPLIRIPATGDGADQPSISPTLRQTEIPDSPPATIHVAEIASQTAIGDTAPSLSMDRYYLSPELIPLLSKPDPDTGIRTFRTRTYVELAEGGTVLLGRDADQHYRVRSGTELVASGPRLEQVEGSLLWRRIAHHDGDADTVMLQHLNDESSETAVPKRSRPATAHSDEATQSTPAFTKNWGLDLRFTASQYISIDNVHYKVLTRIDAREYPITYIQSPTHPTYDFDLLEAILRHTPDDQPRGAIRVPPDNHWEIDARLPFKKPLTSYVREDFPEVTTVTLENIARRQFELANDSPFADAAGLTALRQMIDSRKSATPSPHPQWSDPLLMLPILPTSPSARGSARAIALPLPSSTGGLERLDFDPLRFRQQWLYFLTTYSPVDFKRFMAGLLNRNGYTVMEPSSYSTFPALVFQRAGHDSVFFMSLHRTSIPKISLPSYTDPNTTGVLLENQIGAAAAKVLRDAHRANKAIWLKGGCEIRPGIADTVFIIRDDNARL